MEKKLADALKVMENSPSECTLSAPKHIQTGYGTPPKAPEIWSRAVDALYVHVPFCMTKCHYCDFYSLAGHLGEADQFLDAMEVEIALWRETQDAKLKTQNGGWLNLETIFVGGGTPTLLEAGRLERLMGMIGGAVDRKKVVEFTVEGNPNTFDRERAEVLVRAGVNRVSFGAQSFVKSELEMLQRDHEPENVSRAVEIAREAGIGNVNVDLIFGVPGQTVASWEYSLSKALELRPEHMSCYSLIYEPNTVMTARMKKGEFGVIDEEVELEMFMHVYKRLKDAGFVRYEVSNYAKLGGGMNRECRHNVHYWKGGNWMAWGPSAGGHLNGFRWKNVGSLAHYLGALLPGDGGEKVLPLTQVEQLSKEAWAGEVAAFWLRLSEGLDYAEFFGRTGVEAKSILERVLGKYAEMGLVEFSEKGVRIKEEGVVVSNRVLRDVVGAFAH